VPARLGQVESNDLIIMASDQFDLRRPGRQPEQMLWIFIGDRSGRRLAAAAAITDQLQSPFTLNCPLQRVWSGLTFERPDC
jgi:hypothetical protein